jgi:internalin A
MPQLENRALERIAQEKQEKTGFLNLSGKYYGLTKLPEELEELVWLTTLDLSHTPIANLSPLAGLSQLQELVCYNTPIADLSPLAGLSQLQKLVCFNTPIADLSPLTGLSQLQLLDCSDTPIADLSPLAGLSQLQSLDCSDTPIADLSPLAGLSQLQWLSCRHTQIADLSPLWPRIRDGWPVRWNFNGNTGIYVENCPLVIPPVEFAIEGPEAVVEYFEQLGDDRRPLNEIKVIFLGEGASGKTSLIKRLRNEAFDPKESQTHGILIRKTPFDIDGETITAHLWDFGGQEVMHATHQFFLSQRCIYVLVLNSRTDDKAEYWLKHASSFGGNSPVLVVLNKTDENPSFEVNRKGLAEKYPQIREFFRLSCKANRGIEEFRDALAAQIARADTRRTPFPAAWLAVKEHFAGMDQDYIDSAEYRNVCAERGVNRPFSQDVLLQFLHDLGVVINFRNLRNFDTQILNPLWLTNGVYRIINSERVANQGGLFHEHDFDAVINDPRYTHANTSEKTFRYPRNKLNYIVRVMEEFELCYPLDRHRHIVPQLLPVSEPDFLQEGAVLHFIIRFPEFLPDSVFPRLMVKLHEYIKGELRWRTGMVLEKRAIFDAAARVRADKEDKQILIDVCGAEPRRFLSYIRETVKEIVADFANLPSTEWVPIPNSGLFRDYDELVDLERMGEKEIAIGKLKRKIAISDLLNGVEEPEMRDEVGQTPVKAFVSYSHKDMEYLQALRAALSPLVRLEKLRLWDDHAIDAGTAWEEKIFRELNEADLVLCLVSSDFIASEFCYTKELAAAMDSHTKGEKTVVPIRIRECHWEDLPLAKIQGTPSRWIGGLDSKARDAAWTEVAKNLGPAIAAAKQRKAKR